MRWLLALILLAGARATFSAENNEAPLVEALMRSQGLAPGKPSADAYGEWGIEVRGTAKNPQLVETDCFPRDIGSWSFSGKRFSYVADNRGEWGGELTVREGNGPPRTLLRENVLFMLPDGRDLYIFSGLDHGGDRGGLHVVENYDSRPGFRSISQLPGTPLAIGVAEDHLGGFLVVSRLALARVRTGNSMVEILMARHAPLNGANSVLQVGRSQILIGLCGGVAQVHLPWHTRPPDATYEIPIVTYWTRE